MQIEVITREEFEPVLRRLNQLEIDNELLKEAMAGEQWDRATAEAKAGVKWRALENAGVVRHKHGSRVTYDRLQVLEYLKAQRLATPENIAA